GRRCVLGSRCRTDDDTKRRGTAATSGVAHAGIVDGRKDYARIGGPREAVARTGVRRGAALSATATQERDASAVHGAVDAIVASTCGVVGSTRRSPRTGVVRASTDRVPRVVAKADRAGATTGAVKRAGAANAPGT